METLKSKVVLITGAASGIGAALAKECARRGAKLVLLDHRDAPLQALGDQVRARGHEVLPICMDVSIDNDVTDAVSAARARFGRIDVVLADAGFEVTGHFEDLTLDDFRRQFETNVFGVIRTVSAALDDLKHQRGSLIIIGSMLGHIALPGSAAYSMSKFAVTALAQVLRYELAPSGVTVMLVSPGNVSTNIRVDQHNALHPNAQEPIPAWLRMPPEVAARRIVSALLRRRSHVVLDRLATMAMAMERLSPTLLQRAVRFGHLPEQEAPEPAVRAGKP